MNMLESLARYTGYGEPNEQLWGIYPAVVEAVNDPDNKGRVQVSCKAISNDYVSGWIQIVQADAGNGYGAYFIPEEQDQVIIAFLNGSTRTPIVLGAIYSAQKLPRIARSTDSTPRYFATPGGHLLLMEDGQGKRIEIVDSTGDNLIRIDTEANKIEVSASGDVDVSAGGNLSLSAAGNITIEAGGNVTVSGTTIALN